MAEMSGKARPILLKRVAGVRVRFMNTATASSWYEGRWKVLLAHTTPDRSMSSSA
jgi:hypothetical protein